jgi:hypothetical protein
MKDDTFFGCEVDHVVSLKHSGPTEAENLAYACPVCNRYKGSDVASLSPETGALVRFFNPRTDRWSEHFRLDGDRIEPITSIGEATARILKLNDFERTMERTMEREALMEISRYPTKQALIRMLE